MQQGRKSGSQKLNNICLAVFAPLLHLPTAYAVILEHAQSLLYVRRRVKWRGQYMRVELQEQEWFRFVA